MRTEPRIIYAFEADTATDEILELVIHLGSVILLSYPQIISPDTEADG